MQRAVCVSSVASFFILMGCSPPPPPACQPDLATYESEVRPRIERYCGTCHGETPNFGAPFTLLDPEALLETHTGGERIVDRMGEVLAEGVMPPVGMPRLPEADADAIAAWASCGTIDVEPSTGLVSSATPFLAPEDPPAGLEALEFRADEYVVGPDVRDDYRCFVFDANIPEDRFVRRFEMIFDETRVLHHVVLLRDPERNTEPGSFDCYDGGGMPPGSQYLYAWAPGQSALEFPEGGLRISPGERFIVQTHYNNGRSIPDVADSSGVRLYLGPTEGPEYGMVAMGPTDFFLPPRMRTEVSSRCTIREPTTLIAGMPHMHLLGSEFSQRIIPAEGTRSTLVELSGWSFETQLFYALPAQLMPGDVIETTCTFQNPGADTVTSGEDTADEMCFDFLYASPPPAERYCDEGPEDQPTDVAYLPGACLPAGSASDTTLARGVWTLASAPPVLAAASVPDGRWLLESMDFYITAIGTPIGQIDLAATYVLGRGQVVTAGGTLTYDVAQDSVVVSEAGVRFGGPGHSSFALAFDDTVTPASGALTCPAGGDVSFDWGLEGDVLTIGFESSDVPSQTLWPRFHFRRQP